MALSDRQLDQITERLVTDLQEQFPLQTLITALRDCVRDHPDEPAELVEQITRMQLQIRRQGQLHGQ